MPDLTSGAWRKPVEREFKVALRGWISPGICWKSIACLQPVTGKTAVVPGIGDTGRCLVIAEQRYPRCLTAGDEPAQRADGNYFKDTFHHRDYVADIAMRATAFVDCHSRMSALTGLDETAS